MAVSAYAAVVSLSHVIDNIQLPARQQLRLDRNQIETLHKKVSFLLDYLEADSQMFCTDREDLARQIADVASEAEDMIDSHVVDQLSRRSTGEADMGLSSFCEDMDKVIEKIESIEKELKTMKEERAVQELQPGVSLPVASSTPPLGGRSTMVGFDEHLIRIMDQLTGHELKLQIIPIIGMGGIGKTTLAQNIFDNCCIVDHFDVRIWVTISQEYSIHEVLQVLVHGNTKGQEGSDNLVELGEKLHKKLFGRRYLIVMDDVWSISVWENLCSFFPKNEEGSRIMVTTRLSNLADSLTGHPYFMNFLDEEESWDLFCDKAFGQECCPPEFEDIGKNIAKSCKGLPLAVVVIGGLLSKSNMTREYWEFVVKNVKTFANLENDEHCLKILFLSYNHLPIYLKPCFLYMRYFGEDEKISVSRLIKLWVDERFLKSIKGKSLEDVAFEYLKDLIDRNMVFIRTLKYNGKIKTCGLHDLLRDLCFRESNKEHFHCVAKVQQAHFTDYNKRCFLCSLRDASTWISLAQALVASQGAPPASGFVCDLCSTMKPLLKRLRFVRLVCAVNGQPTEEFLQPTKLCRLSLTWGFEYAFNLMPLLWNLQTLIISAYGKLNHLPSEIWKMPQLRHIAGRKVVFSNPRFTKAEHLIVLQNLQTLSTVTHFHCSDEVVKRIPNLKTLKLFYLGQGIDYSFYSLHNLPSLCKLESFSLYWNSLFTKRLFFHSPNKKALPHSLKKLSLSWCRMPWENMTIIGSLPNLEVLKILCHAFEGPEWNPVEGEFLRLKLLIIRVSLLECWRAERSHFPVLERLVLREMFRLEMIPPDIGEIGPLRSIHLSLCLESAANSAQEIIEEQRGYRNEDLQLHIDGYWQNEVGATSSQ